MATKKTKAKVTPMAERNKLSATLTLVVEYEHIDDITAAREVVEKAREQGTIKTAELQVHRDQIVDIR